jgi:hypothetical protein
LVTFEVPAPTVSTPLLLKTAGPVACKPPGSALGDEQAKAKLCRVESGEVAVAFGPPA